MAKLPVPDFVNDPGKVQKFGQWWMKNYYKFYTPPNLETKPHKYNIEFASLKAINESFILTKWGFTINSAVFTDHYTNDFAQWSRSDGVYYPAHWKDGSVVIPIHNMRDITKDKNRVHYYSYKQLCDSYLKSSRDALTELLPNNKFW